MADGLIFWPLADGESVGWLRLANGRIVQRGEGTDWRTTTGLPALPEGDDALMLAPAADVALHWIACPGMTLAQGAAAAPLLALESSIGGETDLHTAVVPACDPAEPHIVAVVDAARMARWINLCAEQGVAGAAILPAALALAAPDEGFVAATVGGAAVLRGPDCALADEDGLSVLLLEGASVHRFGEDAVEASLATALADPPLDLRQGAFARRVQLSSNDRARVRRIGWLAAACAALLLLDPVAKLARMRLDVAALDRQSIATARTVAPQVETVEDARTAVSAKVSARGGNGFANRLGALMREQQAFPGLHFRALSAARDGQLRGVLASARGADIAIFAARLRAAGWRASTGTPRADAGETLVDLTVEP